MRLKIECSDCELFGKCSNKPQRRCFNYNKFEPINSETETENLPAISKNSEGNLVLSDDFKLGECQLCGVLDSNLEYEQITPFVYACSNCIAKIRDNDNETNTLIDMIFEAEEYARKHKVNKELSAILFTVVQALKDAIHDEPKALLDLVGGCKVIAHREAKRMLEERNLLNKGDENRR